MSLEAESLLPMEHGVVVLAFHGQARPTIAGLQQVFGIDPGAASRLYQSVPVTVKRTRSRKECDAYVVSLRSLGAEVVVRAAHDAGAAEIAELDPDDLEEELDLEWDGIDVASIRPPPVPLPVPGPGELPPLPDAGETLLDDDGLQLELDEAAPGIVRHRPVAPPVTSEVATVGALDHAASLIPPARPRRVQEGDAAVAIPLPSLPEIGPEPGGGGGQTGHTPGGDEVGGNSGGRDGGLPGRGGARGQVGRHLGAEQRPRRGPGSQPDSADREGPGDAESRRGRAEPAEGVTSRRQRGRGRRAPPAHQGADDVAPRERRGGRARAVAALVGLGGLGGFALADASVLYGNATAAGVWLQGAATYALALALFAGARGPLFHVCALAVGLLAAQVSNAQLRPRIEQVHLRAEQGPVSGELMLRDAEGQTIRYPLLTLQFVQRELTHMGRHLRVRQLFLGTALDGDGGRLRVFGEFPSAGGLRDLLHQELPLVPVDFNRATRSSVSLPGSGEAADVIQGRIELINATPHGARHGDMRIVGRIFMNVEGDGGIAALSGHFEGHADWVR